MPFTAELRRPGSIEIPQAHKSKTVGLLVPVASPLERQLGIAVRIGRHRRIRFVDQRILRFPIHSSSRGKHQPLNSRRAHRFQQRQACNQIVSVIFSRIAVRIADDRAGRHMNHSVYLVSSKRPFQLSAIQNLALDKFRPRQDRVAMPLRQIVINQSKVPRGEQLLNHHAPNISSPAGNQYPHPRIITRETPSGTDFSLCGFGFAPTQI